MGQAFKGMLQKGGQQIEMLQMGQAFKGMLHKGGQQIEMLLMGQEQI